MCDVFVPEEEPASLRLTARQAKILQLLDKEDSKLGQIYRGIIYANTHTDNPDYMSQTAHEVRELLVELPRHFGAKIPSGFSEKNELDRLLPIWEEANKGVPPLEVVTGGGEADSVEIPVRVYRELRDFFNRFEAARFKHREKVSMLLGTLEPVPIPSAPELLGPVIKQWLGLYDWFLAVAHHGRQCNSSEFDRKVRLFEDTVFALLSPFYEPIEQLEPLLAIERPAEQDIERALALLKKKEHVAHFFRHLRHPGWLAPLGKAGYFRSPPPPEKSDGGVRYPGWPEAAYLKAVAQVAPKEVADIIKSLPRVENVTVQHQLLDAVLSMPSEIASELVGVLKRWVLTPSPLRLPGKFGELMRKFAQEGESERALELADTLFEPVLESRRTVRLGPVETRLPSKVKSYLDDWDYSQILQLDFPAVLVAAPSRAYRLLASKLRRAISLTNDKERRQGKYDASPAWRPAVEPHEQNRTSEGVRNALVTALRDSGEWILANEPELAEQFLDYLHELDAPIFQRLELHLLRMAPEALAERAVQQLGNRRLFENLTLRHEYVLLLSEKLSSLPGEVQQRIFDWIEKGPDEASYVNQTKAFRNREPTEQEIAGFVGRWQLTWLAPIKASLPHDWKERYRDLEQRYGEPEHPEFIVYGESFMGPTSPVAEEEMGRQDPEEILRYLREWIPADEDFGPSREGLGRVLSSVVAENPARYETIYGHLREGVEPTYVRAVLSGFREACKAGREFNWEPVLDLSEWVLQQPRDELDRRPGSEANSDWVNTRWTTAGLLSEGLSSKDSAIPIRHRETVWSLLATLLDDPEPASESETAAVTEYVDRFREAINSVRGLAMEGVIRYALWASQQLADAAPREGESRRVILSSLPEVREVLELRLDPLVESSPAVRSVYGRYLPTLLYLDEEWVRENLSGIFPRDRELETLRLAAFQAFLTYNRPHIQLASLMEKEYRWAVGMLAEEPPEKGREEFWTRLADHLMTLYWHGYFSLSEGSAVLQFFEEAPPATRSYAISFLGRSLQDVDSDELTPETKERLRNLWDNRLGASAPYVSEELEEFGFWVANDVLDPSWVVYRLRKTLELTGGSISVGYQVLGRLAALAEEYPSEAVGILDLMVRGDRSGMEVYRWKDQAHALLDSVIQGSDERAKAMAGSIIHHLGSRGIHDFRDLLTSQDA